MVNDPNSAPSRSDDSAPTPAPVPVIRTAVAGVLMGLANLVPGVSGGTMILVMGLYDRFIESISEVTRLKFTRRNITFLAIVCGSAGIAVICLAGVLLSAVTLHRSAMFSLFIGMTLGGAPLLMKMIGKRSASSVAGVIVGVALMILISATHTEPPNKEEVRAAIARGDVVVEPSYARDVAAGALGMSAMVLPGISGAYMLLVIGRFESTYGAIHLLKGYLTSGAETDPTVFLRVLIPIAIGAALGLAVLSSLLKWLLHRYERPTLGVLLGIVLGSVIGIWPFSAASTMPEIGVGVLLALVGFVATALLSRIKA